MEPNSHLGAVSGAFFQILLLQLYEYIDSTKIRLIAGYEKCRHLKKLTRNGTLRQVFICLRPRTHPPPHHTLYTCIHYTYSHTQGSGGRGDGPERRLEGQHSSQRRVENTNMTDCISNTGHKVPVQVNLFRRRHFALMSIYLISL